MNFHNAVRLSDDSQESTGATTLLGDDVLTDKATGSSRWTLGPWTIAACILCTIVNVFTMIWSPPSFTLPPRPLTSLTPNEGRLLRRPSQFMGLDKVSRPSPPQPTSLLNYPIVILPVDSEHSRKVFDHSPKRHSSQVGMITPEDRRVVVTDTLSSIVQFRAMDYGMEKCEINIRLPALSKLPFTPPSSVLSVYKLDTKYALDTSLLSYAKRPRRLAKLADIGFHDMNDVRWNTMLACPSESVLTVELACSTATGSSCNFEFWQDKVPEITSADAGKHWLRSS
ncbi:hypothetical protein EIP86_011191 [Pleurotus ostreatoroseus]|nr:hypothetical protein EIP86_011191 [Pleurotus ostreatoroseus]